MVSWWLEHDQLVAAQSSLISKELAPNMLNSSPTSMMHLVTWQTSWKIKIWSSRSLSHHPSMRPHSRTHLHLGHSGHSGQYIRLFQYGKLYITSSTIPLPPPHMRSSMMNFAGHGFVLLWMVRCNFNSFRTLCLVNYFVVCTINVIFVVQPLKSQNIEWILEQKIEHATNNHPHHPIHQRQIIPLLNLHLSH